MVSKTFVIKEEQNVLLLPTIYGWKPAGEAVLMTIITYPIIVLGFWSFIRWFLGI